MLDPANGAGRRRYTTGKLLGPLEVTDLLAGQTYALLDFRQPEDPQNRFPCLLITWHVQGLR
jgi:hypothetical protein